MLTENHQTLHSPLVTRLLITCGAIGPLLWALYSLVTGILFVGFFIACLVVAQLDKSGVFPNSPAGLLERIAILIGWGWIALLALRLLRHQVSSRCDA